jgi:GPH family glycoside/pentoside/hexuronide:cation symporter
MTMYCTPYNALISEFGKTQEDRMYISTTISLTFFFGTLIAYLPFVFASFLQSAVSYAWSYRILFIILAGVALVCMLIPCIKLKEKDFVDAQPSESNAMKSLSKTFKNRNFRRFAASDIAYWIGLTLFQTGLPFFVKVSMQLDEFYTTVFLGAMTVLSACFYPFVSRLVAKHGKKKLVIIGFFGLAVAYVITALIGVIPGLTGIIPGVLIVIVAAFPMALLGIIPQAIVADVAEQDALVTGEKREGMFFAARTFAMKFGQSIAMLVFTSLAVLGAAQDLSSNDLTASPVGLRIVAIVAVCFCVLGAVILFSYDEKKVMKDITEGKE